MSLRVVIRYRVAIAHRVVVPHRVVIAHRVGGPHRVVILSEAKDLARLG
ncbi:hypothetical protein K8I61_13610 [bacterium]|nr:hypothetical protein [bacterium]